MRILVIDCNIDLPYWGAENLRRYARKVPGATIHVRRAPEDDLPRSPREFDRVVVSGSKTSAMENAPWISHLHEFIRGTINAGKPFLGVCYGHQSLARALGDESSVRLGSPGEWGWTKIEIIRKAPLFEGLPNVFHSFSAHNDEVSKLPPGMVHIARSADCPIQACQLGDKPVYGIQFHPEKNLPEAEHTFALEWRDRKIEKLLHPKESKKYFDENVGNLIFGNFFKGQA